MELQGSLTLSRQVPRTHRQLLEASADDFVCSYLRYSVCYEDNNTTIRFSVQ
jgi:hypothetical protein